MGPTCLNGIVLAVCRSQAQAFNRSRRKDSATLLLIEFVYLVASLTPSDIGRDHLILSADQVTTDEHEANSRSLLQRCRFRSVLAARRKRPI